MVALLDKEPMDIQVIGSREEITIIILLNGHKIRRDSNDLSLYP